MTDTTQKWYYAEISFTRKFPEQGIWPVKAGSKEEAEKRLLDLFAGQDNVKIHAIVEGEAPPDLIALTQAADARENATDISTEPEDETPPTIN